METSRRTLPENAYRPLKPGEVYTPLVKPGEIVPEWTTRSVTMGVLMAALFSAAAAFLGFKVGQVFEAAIPIAILAVGIGVTFKRRSTLLENVIVQSIGAASGLIVAGSIFTIPGLFILGLPVDLFKLFLVALFGGILGILLLIPLRRYFVKEMHGELPFPEATATTEILVAGESGGKQAKVLAVAAAVGGVFDFLVIHFSAFSELVTSKAIPYLRTLGEKARLELRIDVLSSVMGLGYIIGLRYAAIICAGSFLSWFLLVPLIGYFGDPLTAALGSQAGGRLISAMDANQIFRAYVRMIGIGGIACAGMLGIIRSWKIIASAFGLGFKELFGKQERATGSVERTDRDLPMKGVLLGLGVLALVIMVFLWLGVLHQQPRAVSLTLIALLVVIVISFLFTTVAAQATATVGSNPVSGMTLMTLILACAILASVGLTGNAGMLAALLIGGIVCTALSTVGGFVTDLKIGYWTGATPAVQQRSKLLGSLVAALTVGSVIMLLGQVYGFVETPETPNPLPAPQANAMATVVKLMMSQEPAPWILYGVGALLILVLQMVKVPALPFALGMYLPQELNVPLLVGGLVAHFVAKSAKGDEKLQQARSNRGTLIASGFIAGGAVMGVLAALLRWISQELKLGGVLGVNLFNNAEGHGAELLALGFYALLVAYMFWDSKRARAED
ncbi:MAG TPA: oligopeptide transporter, OPT family [Thermoanaerobaculaceae bacterium]|nr:oligopeptide transporter, OPT family [Acidobacteriota bacterium]NLH11793.1 oligopeptide transporter, OPT family [Holophagae bacterium]HPW56337.1 oligopeptide transporter, OPT family [Thermoanaerobaculaceae bacterium]